MCAIHDLLIFLGNSDHFVEVASIEKGILCLSVLLLYHFWRKLQLNLMYKSSIAMSKFLSWVPFELCEGNIVFVLERY